MKNKNLLSQGNLSDYLEILSNVNHTDVNDNHSYALGQHAKGYFQGMTLGDDGEFHNYGRTHMEDILKAADGNGSDYSTYNSMLPVKQADGTYQYRSLNCLAGLNGNGFDIDVAKHGKNPLTMGVELHKWIQANYPHLFTALNFTGHGLLLMIVYKHQRACNSVKFYRVWKGIETKIADILNTQSPVKGMVDMSTLDGDRLMRLPGTINKKSGHKPVQSFVMYLNAKNRPTFDQLDEKFLYQPLKKQKQLHLIERNTADSASLRRTSKSFQSYLNYDKYQEALDIVNLFHYRWDNRGHRHTGLFILGSLLVQANSQDYYYPQDQAVDKGWAIKIIKRVNTEQSYPLPDKEVGYIAGQITDTAFETAAKNADIAKYGYTVNGIIKALGITVHEQSQPWCSFLRSKEVRRSVHTAQMHRRYLERRAEKRAYERFDRANKAKNPIKLAWLFAYLKREKGLSFRVQAQNLAKKRFYAHHDSLVVRMSYTPEERIISRLAKRISRLIRKYADIIAHKSFSDVEAYLERTIKGAHDIYLYHYLRLKGKGSLYDNQYYVILTRIIKHRIYGIPMSLLNSRSPVESTGVPNQDKSQIS